MMSFNKFTSHEVIFAEHWDKIAKETLMRVMNDHRSKFSNLSNWKEEA